MLRLSIIVPAMGRQADLDDTLLSVLEERPQDCEILVPHPSSYRDPYELADELTFVPSQSNNPLELCNVAIGSAKADVIHVLHAGTKVTPGWAESALEQLEFDGDVDVVSPAVLDVTSSSNQGVVGVRYGRGGSCKFVRPGRRTPRIPQIDGPCPSAAFFRRSALASIGCFDAQLGPYDAAADIAAKLRRSGLTCVHNPDCVVMGPTVTRPVGFVASRGMERVYRRHAAASNSLASAVTHLLAVIENVVRQLPSPACATSLLGHMLGAVEYRLRPAACHWKPQPGESQHAASERATIAFRTPVASHQEPERRLRRSA